MCDSTANANTQAPLHKSLQYFSPGLLYNLTTVRKSSYEDWRTDSRMMFRLFTIACLVLLLAACSTPAARTSASFSSYDSIVLSVGVINLINTSRGRPIALENDDRIQCVDMNPPGHPTQSRFCQTHDEFNTNLERGRDLIRSINSNTQP